MKDRELKANVCEAKKLFEDGDCEGCIAILSEDRLNNDYFSNTKSKHTKDEASLFIKAHALAIDALMKNDDSFEVIEEIERRYKVVAHEAEKYEVEIDEIKKYGVFEYSQGNNKKAEHLFDKVLEIYTRLAKSNYEKYEPEIARNYNNLGNLYSETQRIEEAESLFWKAIDIQKRLVESKPNEYELDLAKSYSNLAILYHECQKYDEAESLFFMALSFYKESLSKANKSVFTTIMLNMAKLYRDSRQHEKEEELLLQVIDIYKTLIESDKTYESNLERCCERYEKVKYLKTLKSREKKSKRSKSEQQVLNEELAYFLDESEHGPTTVEEISDLLERGANPMAEREGRPLVYWVTQHQPAEIVKMFLDKSGFDVNYKSDEEDGPEPLIYWAAYNRDLRVFSMLINEYGAECPLEDDHNPITRICTIKGNQNNTFKTTEDFYLFLRDECHIDDQNVFWNAVRADYLDLCIFMKSEKGIDLEKEKENGNAAIHLSIHPFQFHDIKVLQWLVNEEHISPETESRTGLRPIHVACSDFPSEAVLSFLVNDCKVDTEIQSGEGLCPIHYIARYGKTWALEMGIDEFHFDYTIEDEDGWIPLDYTIFNKNVECTKYLVKKYGKAGIQSAYERAFIFNKLEYVQFLSEDCGFDLKKEQWVEVYKYEDADREWEETTMEILLRINNAEIYKYCFEKHYGKKYPKPEAVPFHLAFINNAHSIIDYLVSIYGAKTYLDCLLDYYSIEYPWDAFCEAARLNDCSLLKHLVVERHVTLEDCSHGDSNFGNEPLFPIHAAIKNGNLEMVKYLVEECKANPVESSLNNGSTVLYAAQENQIEIADYLVKVAQDLGIANACYSVILAFAEGGEYKKALKYVEKYKANVNDLVCYFSKSCHKNVVGFLKKVYAKYDVDLTYEDGDGNTALLNSLYNGSFEIFKWLVEDCGQNPVEVMEEGSNALILAARAENPELVRYLVEKCNLDVNSKDGKGNSVIINAINGRNLSAEENCEIIHYLVKHGADINSQDSDKENILHYIARNSFYDIEEFEKFIEEGADYASKNKDLKTPLHIASEAGRLDIVQSLIEKHDVNPNLQCCGKATAAHRAAKSNQTEIVKWLIESGYTKVNRKDMYGDSILTYAVIGFCNSSFNDDDSKLELVRWLVENGANCNSMTPYGITPLHEAALRGNLIAVKYFIEECGMDPSIHKKEDGMKYLTPAEYARGERSVVRYLHKKEKEYNQK